MSDVVGRMVEDVEGELRPATARMVKEFGIVFSFTDVQSCFLACEQREIDIEKRKEEKEERDRGKGERDGGERERREGEERIEREREELLSLLCCCNSCYCVLVLQPFLYMYITIESTGCDGAYLIDTSPPTLCELHHLGNRHSHQDL